MKTPTPLLVIAAFLAVSTARAQFPNFPAADRVLGVADFTTPGTGAATAAAMNGPSGVAVDPLTNKLFISANNQHRVLRFASAASLTNGANAEAVLGQVNFSGTASGATATTFNGPYGLHVDGSGRLWVADFSNNRVLMFQGASSLDFGPTPDRVFGQPNFTTVSPGTSSTKMFGPVQVHVDAVDNLWVADFNNHRVLKFANVSSLPSGAAATSVLGQPDFVTGIGGTSAVTMSAPTSVTVDGAGRLWVGEQNNNRVLRFDNAVTLGNGAPANGVLGQPGFVTNTFGTTAQNMIMVGAVLVDTAGTLYVLEFGNNRVLVFKNAATKADGAAADGVIGQPDFTTGTAGTTPRKLNGPFGGLALDGAGRLWMVDSANNRALRFSPDRFVAPPRVTVRVPRSTTRATLALKGTAADPSGIAQVRHRVGGGAFRPAAGKTSWRFTARLRPRVNTIEIVAVDTVGNTSRATRLRVTRRGNS